MIICKKFSDKKKSDRRDKIKSAARITGLVGLVGLSRPGGIIHKHHLYKSLEEVPDSLKEENKRLHDQLAAKSESKIIQKKKGKSLRKLIKNETDASGLKYTAKEKKELLNGVKEFEHAGCYLSNADTIISDRRASTLAHEYGHSRHYHGRDGSKIGTIAHKMRDASGRINSILKKLKLPKPGRAASVGIGFVSGYNAEKKKEKGEKESAINKLSPGAVAISSELPVIISEAAASRRGIKELKNLGASKGYLRYAKKAYRHGLGTYLTVGALTNLGLAYGSRETGTIARRLKNKIAKNKKKDDNKKKSPGIQREAD